MIERKSREGIAAIRRIRLRWPGARATRSEPLRQQRAGIRLRVAPGVHDVWSRFLLARLMWILLMTVFVTASAGGFLLMQKPIYKSQATVAVYPASGASSAVQPFVMGTEKGIASSGAVLSLASQSLLIPVTKLQSGLSITIPVDSDLLVISYSDRNPQVAQSAAEAIAQAYVAYRTTALGPASGKSGSSSTAALQVAVVTDAALPISPDGPNPLLTLGVALLVGLSLGVGLALLLDWLDDGLRGPADLQAQSGSPVLAQIPAVKRTRRGLAAGLIVVEHPDSPVADAYGNLRTRVLQAAAMRQARVLLVTSPGRESDQTTVAANLAAAAALSGRRVALVVHEVSLADALATTEVPGLDVLAGGPMWPVSSSVHQSRAFIALLKKLRAGADLVVVDGPPVLASADAAALAEEAGMVLLVADARISSRADVRAATHELQPVRDRLIGCVLDNVGRPRRMGMPSQRAATSGDQQETKGAATPVAITELPHSEISQGNGSAHELILEAAVLDGDFTPIAASNGAAHTEEKTRRRRHEGRNEL